MACLPLAFKLGEMEADPNVVTRANETPISLTKIFRPEDTEHEKEARAVIVNMLRSYGGADSWHEAIQRAKIPKARPRRGPETSMKGEDGSEIVSQAIDKKHTRF